MLALLDVIMPVYGPSWCRKASRQGRGSFSTVGQSWEMANKSGSESSYSYRTHSWSRWSSRSWSYGSDMLPYSTSISLSATWPPEKVPSP
jgi:hypothetical protein